MRARVYESGDRVILAGGLTGLAIAAVAAIFSRTVDFGMHDKLSLACAVAFGCIVPSLTWRSRGSLRKIEPGAGRLRIGSRTIDATKVNGFGAVEGTHGWSVAVNAGARTTLLEVARRADAEQIAKSVRRKWPRDGVVMFEVPSSRMRRWQSALSVAGALLAALYWACATVVIDLEVGQPLFGVSMLAIGAIAVLLFFVRVMRSAGWLAVTPGLAQLGGRNVTAVERATNRPDVPERVSIVTHAAGRARRDELVGRGVGAHAIAHVRDALGSPARVEPDVDSRNANLMADASESVREWLARLDAWSREEKAGGYRGNLPAREDLWRVLRDEEAPIEARLAAGRLLHARYGETPDVITQGVGDGAVRKRVRVAIDDPPEEAAEHLDRLGPVFEARVRANG